MDVKVNFGEEDGVVGVPCTSCSVFARGSRQVVSFRWSLISELLTTQNHCC